MTNTNHIQRAATVIELDNLVEQVAAERNCELDSSMSYKEQAEFFTQEAPKAGNGQDDMTELSTILNAAETKWHELEAK